MQPTNHDGAPLVDDVGAAPDGIGELASASISRLRPYPVRALLVAGLVWIAGFVLAMALFLGKRDPFSVACVASLVGGPLVACFVILTAALIGFRARTFVGTDGIALIRGARTIVFPFTDVRAMPNDLGTRGRPGASIRYRRLRVVDRSGRTRLDVMADVPERGGRTPRTNGYHFIVRAHEAWIAWWQRRNAVA